VQVFYLLEPQANKVVGGCQTKVVGARPTIAERNFEPETWNLKLETLLFAIG
jgi:hypothetical protein